MVIKRDLFWRLSITTMSDCARSAVRARSACGSGDMTVMVSSVHENAVDETKARPDRSLWNANRDGLREEEKNITVLDDTGLYSNTRLICKRSG